MMNVNISMFCGYSVFPMKQNKTKNLYLYLIFSLYFSLGFMQRVIVISVFHYLMHQILPAVNLTRIPSDEREAQTYRRIHSLESELVLDQVTDSDEKGIKCP